MKPNFVVFDTEFVYSQVSCYHPDSGTREAHVLICPKAGLTTVSSWQTIQDELNRVCNYLGYSNNSCLFLRVFTSDALNQEILLKLNYPEVFDANNRPYVSFVQQPPMPGIKMAIWAYLVKGEQPVEKTEFGKVYQSNGLSHIWTANLLGSESADSFWQTERMFFKYNSLLKSHNSHLFENAIRTWIYVRDIDTFYKDVVTARKLIFEEKGLTEKTHYIASTGIEGKNENPYQYVFMDAYTIAGILPGQVTYLQAKQNMSPTHYYGVTFERGTQVTFGDRKHIYISGTASIDKNGEILYPEDVEKQTERIVENMVALLNEAESDLSHLAFALVYIRDSADYNLVSKKVRKLLPGIPALILVAPICRPSWLVEIEGIAICQTRTEFPKY